MEPDFVVVGIGYSAGGIPPLKRFFEQIPTKSGLSFVVVQHLHRRQSNRLKEILTPSTQLKIEYISDSMIMQPDHIYLLQSNQYVKIWDHHLYLLDRREEDIVNQAIDTFFESLALEKKEQAIGIILSGGGNDGAKGCIRIHEEGGKVMVQSPQSAEFHFLPNHVIEADNPIAVERPEDLAHTLLDITRK
ncbi:chemotaxis protein CheB [Catalinimonas sp. 4WD22]|uniref:chemotaxis protein CheB n=1 Tax=Catalinimonas locisalis TaxID=3133978 RepID=UPI0031012421